MTVETPVRSKGTARDFVTLLRRDHERMSSLFNQIQGKPNTPERHRLFRQLKRELDLHAAVENLHVYRVFQQAEPTREALDAHSKVKILLDEPEAAPSYGHKWKPQFQELHKLIQINVANENNEIFRKTEAVMTPQEAEERGVTVE